MNQSSRDKDSSLEVWINFLKSFLLYSTFAAGLLVFAVIRGFNASELPVLAVSFTFIVVNLLIYSYSLASGFYKHGNTSLAPAVWTGLMAFPGLNILVFFKMRALNKKILERMNIQGLSLIAMTKQRLGFTLVVSLAIVVGVFHWLTMTQVSGLTQLGRLKESSRPESPYAKAFKESAALMQKGEFYQGLQLLRKRGDMTPEERRICEDMLKTGYQGHAFVLSERVLSAIQEEGKAEAVQQPLGEYLRWVEIYCDLMGIPREALSRLKEDIGQIQDVFPPGRGASFQEIRHYYREKAGALVKDETAQALLQTYVDVLLFNALYNVQDSHPIASP